MLSLTSFWRLAVLVAVGLVGTWAAASCTATSSRETLQGTGGDAGSGGEGGTSGGSGESAIGGASTGGSGGDAGASGSGSGSGGSGGAGSGSGGSNTDAGGASGGLGGTSGGTGGALAGGNGGAGGSEGATGGTGAGGSAGSAGVSGSASSGGSAGVSGSASTGGSAGVSGSAGTAGAGGSGGSGPRLSSGCGSPTALESGTFTIDVDGTERGYILSMPNNYDQQNPYKLIFGFHWRGASAIDIENNDFYGLRNIADDTAIFVSPAALGDGWSNTGGTDIDFTLALVNHLKAEACVDEARVFSLGFSYGGMMSFAVGCALGDVFRAIAPFAGALFSGCENGTQPVAMWGAHGYANGADGVVGIADGRTGRDVFLQRNGCTNQTVPVAPDECVAYQGCRDGYPVTWCEWNGGHSIPPFATNAIWNFFSQF